MNLDEKIEKAKKVIIKGVNKRNPHEIAIAWTGGKDSTVILHLIRSIYQGKVPFRVMFNDSTLEFPEIYSFVKEITNDWELDLIWMKHLPKDLRAYQQAKNTEEKMEIMRIAKINAIKEVRKKHNITAFISGIRWDEHEARSKEKYLSPRVDHLRIHPILHFTLGDIWSYIRKFNVPYVDLYDKGYKSLGEQPFTNPVSDPNAPERAGREATKEKTMERLRKLGYW